MRTSLSRRSREPGPGEGTARARVDRRTKNLTKRLGPGQIAVIDHEDIDRVSAEALIACRPAAIVNAAASISGRYPNIGPQLIVEAGIPLIDACGPDLTKAITEDTHVRLEDGVVRDAATGTILAEGTVLTAEGIQSAMAVAREGLSGQLQSFAQNTMEYLVREKDLLLSLIHI